MEVGLKFICGYLEINVKLLRVGKRSNPFPLADQKTRNYLFV